MLLQKTKYNGVLFLGRGNKQCLGRTSFFVIHDDELGVVWSPELGSMRITDAKHSERLEECLSRYVSGELSEKEEFFSVSYAFMRDLRKKLNKRKRCFL